MKSKPEKGDALLIGIGAEPDDDDAEMAEEYGAEKEEAAQHLLDAIKSGDAAGVAEAFTTLKRVC